jgi:threonine synthase
MDGSYSGHPGVLSRYAEFLPVTEATPKLSLGEGDTPLVRSTSLERDLGAGAVYFKLEGCNPTGSFKDRGMVVTMAKAVEAGSQAVICASTGNTSASAAAYAARAGLTAVVIVPEGYVALGKLAQAMIYGARVILIRGNFDDALNIVRNLSENHPITVVNSINRFRIEGQKSGAFEICDELGDAPDYLAIPVGNAGNITAYWMGYGEEYAAGRATRRPRMFGFQASGAAPIVTGQVVVDPVTIATAIRIGNPASWTAAVDARDASGGLIRAVTDREILSAYRMLAHSGVFVELASAASVAGLLAAAADGTLAAGSTVVATVTGHGLKDPEWAISTAAPPTAVPNDAAAAARALGLA